MNKTSFEVLRKIKQDPVFSQRELAEELGFSLGNIKLLFKSTTKKGISKTKKFPKKKTRLVIFNTSSLQKVLLRELNLQSIYEKKNERI